MKKFVNKIIAPLAGLVVVTPIVCVNTTSCVSKHVEITKIRLSSRYKYIYPGQDLKIKAEVFPYGASKDDIKWDIESSIEGFSISNIGKIHAPASFPPTDEPISINVIASSKTNPNVSTSYSIIATDDQDHELLGFAGDFKYMDRGGQTVTKKIKHKMITTVMGDIIRVYYLEGTDPEVDDPSPSNQDGMPLYAGRENEFFDFTPVFKTGKDIGMTFELSNSYDFDNQAIS
ncbi:MAG: hypothetical protein MJ201_05590 [Mycoplasmoidaceae bacterium]|nr:hypothetical protein [Mycoplasmoidaceae bacterium]